MKLKIKKASFKDVIIYENLDIEFNQVGMTFFKGDS